jgi:hypothetical protein
MHFALKNSHFDLQIDSRMRKNSDMTGLGKLLEVDFSSRISRRTRRGFYDLRFLQTVLLPQNSSKKSVLWNQNQMTKLTL